MDSNFIYVQKSSKLVPSYLRNKKNRLTHRHNSNELLQKKDNVTKYAESKVIYELPCNSNVDTDSVALTENSCSACEK